MKHTERNFFQDIGKEERKEGKREEENNFLFRIVKR